MARLSDRAVDLPPIGNPAGRRRRPPETPEQRARRMVRLQVQLAEREERARLEIATATGALPRNRHGQVRRLEEIEDPERRLEVQRARVERLEALAAKLNRKRETRAKIIIGAALFAEARDAETGDLLERFRDILDRRVERPQDRLAILEAFGIPLQPVREDDGVLPSPPLPDFDALMRPGALSATVRGGQVHPDYKGLRARSGKVTAASKARRRRPDEPSQG